MTEPRFNDSQMVTAMCLWEAWLDLLGEAKNGDEDPDVKAGQAFVDEHGSFTIRSALVELVEACDDGWQALQALTDDDAPCFDWEWCPSFVRSCINNGTMAWRDIGHPNNWIGSRGSGRLDVFTLTLHPQPDRVLAEYTAWRLTQ